MKKLALLLCCMVGLLAARKANAFVLIGPMDANATAQGGVDFNYTDDLGGPKDLKRFFRWNIPMLTYAFDASFMQYFGLEGRDAVKEAVEVAADGTDAVYVSIDIDVVDAAYAPGAGVPVFEGISAKDFLVAAETLSEFDIIGAIDLCEVSPPFDTTGRTAYLAANALVTFLSPYLFDIVDLD
mgnify:CR=1 FL=1